MANIPILGIIGAPVIAGMLLITYKIGIEAFCQWSKEKDLRKETGGNWMIWGLKLIQIPIYRGISGSSPISRCLIIL